MFSVPVFGDDTNEPCHDAGEALKDRGCVQGWRWNLDYVVDTHDNAATYWYEKETNTYARLGDVKDPVQYVRGGYLHWIKYGSARTPCSRPPQVSAWSSAWGTVCEYSRQVQAVDQVHPSVLA